MIAMTSRPPAPWIPAGLIAALLACAGGCNQRPAGIPARPQPTVANLSAPETLPIVKTYNEAMALTTDLQYDQAALKFQEVINPLDEIGDRGRAAEGMFWLGYCREKQGMTEEAMRVYRRLTEVYPGSAPARRAGQRLIELNRPPDTLPPASQPAR